jgi:mannosyltransferase
VVRPAHREQELTLNNAVLQPARFRVAGRDIAYEYVLLAAVSLLAAVLRFYKLGEWSFWLDEVITVDASAFLADWPLTRLPIYLVLTRVSLDLFGSGEWNARLAPAVAGVLTIPVLYFPTRRLFGPAVALLSALLLALSMWHVHWSQSARFYTLLLLFYNLGLLLFILGFKERRLPYYVAAVLFLVLAVRERTTGLFFAPVIAFYLATVWLLVPGNRLRRYRRVLLPLFGLGVVLGLYDLALFFLQLPGSLFGDVWHTFVGHRNQNPIRLSLAIVYQIGAPLLVLGTLGGAYLSLKWTPRSEPSSNSQSSFRQLLAPHNLQIKDNVLYYVLVGAIVPPILLAILSLVMFAVDRYIFVTLPFWCLLGAVTLKEVAGHSRRLAAALLLALLLMSVGQLVLYYEVQNGNRPAWRQAMAVVAQRQEPGDLVLSTTPPVARHYLDGNVRDINHAPREWFQSGRGRVWFVVDDSIGWVEPGLYDWIRQNAALVEIVDVAIPGRSLAIRVYLYEPGT